MSDGHCTDGTDRYECPNCGDETKKTGNATPGNTPERKCPSCRWLNWHARPSHTGPPYERQQNAVADRDGGER